MATAGTTSGSRAMPSRYQGTAVAFGGPLPIRLPARSAARGRGDTAGRTHTPISPVAPVSSGGAMRGVSSDCFAAVKIARQDGQVTRPSEGSGEMSRRAWQSGQESRMGS